MRRRSRALIAAGVLLMLLLSGCWNRRELEEYAFVLALGIDKGKRDAYAVTASIAIPLKIAGKEAAPAGGGTEQPLVVTTVEAPTIPLAIQMMDSYIDRRVSLLHTKSVFIGEEQAREDALGPIRQLIRFREARRTLFFAVTRDKAADFLEKLDVKIEHDPQRFVQQLARAQQYTGFVPDLGQLHDVLAQIESKRASPLAYYVALRDEEKEKEDWAEKARPDSAQHGGAYVSGEIPRKGGPNVDMMGAAVVYGGRLTGLLTGQETRWVLLLRNQFQRGFFAVHDPQAGRQHVTVDIRAARAPRVNVQVDAARVRIDVRLPLEGELITIEGSTDYTQPPHQALLEQTIERHLKQQVDALVRKAQTELRADIFGFGDWVARRFATVQEWNRFDWERRFPEAEIHIETDMTLRRFGTQLAPPTD